ncbi:hypothetical protein ACFQMF_15235 [Halorubrum rutilum]|uniref:Uncharacterized protein n=1 Tax=Halorubrum rutilum TaxID=1364933 RepID=A0ABD6ANP1_9EURY|nr:hypothetical protein [Halorubrum rutilum]
MNANPFRSAYRTGVTVLMELYARNRILCLVAVANLSLAVVFTALMALDGRTVLGRNVWTKPWKFATSIAVFTGTMGWILPSLSLSIRVERLATTVIGGAMTIEIVLISTQAARGVASHFNDTTLLNTVVYAVMGITITISSLVVAYVLWRVVRNPPDLAPAYLWGVAIGMFVFVIASFEGWLMVSEGGHGVGVANDARGLPLLNWSVTGGDLRVAHFVGLHALQVVPLAGYVLSGWETLAPRESVIAVSSIGILYGGITLVTFIQAVLGHSLISSLIIPWLPPSFGAGIVLVGVICGTVLLAATWQRAERTDETSPPKTGF